MTSSHALSFDPAGEWPRAVSILFSQPPDAPCFLQALREASRTHLQDALRAIHQMVVPDQVDAAREKAISERLAEVSVQ